MTRPSTTKVSAIAQITDHVRDLTRAHDQVATYLDRGDQVEVYTTGSDLGGALRHHVMAPALLVQLGADTRDTSIDGGNGARGTYDSKPPARIDAIDTLARIDLEAARWIHDITGQWTSATETTVDVVRRVGALAASADVEQQEAIAKSVRGWHVAARVVTGWDQPAWAPDATCPVCEERGTLRIRFLDRVGMCVDPGCRAWWDTGTIGLLADHVSGESMGLRVHGRQPACQILGDFEPEDLEHLCKACGSARCLRAVGARLAALSAEAPSMTETEARRRQSLRAWKAWVAS